MTNDEAEAEVRSMIVSRVGQEALFREGILVFPCRVAAAECDAWGVRIGLAPIVEPGFIYPGREAPSLAAAWNWGSFSEDFWCGGQGAAWSLNFDGDLLRALRASAAVVAKADRMARWTRLTDEIDAAQRPRGKSRDCGVGLA